MTASGWVSLELQGDFDIVCSLGSLAPRLLFSAVEDSCQLAFPRLLKSETATGHRDSSSAVGAFTVLTGALRLVVLLGLTIVVFAQAYSWQLLALYAGTERADTGASMLRVFALYVLILAVNGVTECFYYSAIGQEELDRHTFRMIGFSVVFLISGSLLVSLYGPVGVIWANCINMILRISISTRFIKQFYAGTAYSLAAIVKESVPHMAVLATYLLSLVFTMISMIYCQPSLASQLVHVSIGAVFVGLNCAVILNKEHSFRTFLLQKLKLKKL